MATIPIMASDQYSEKNPDEYQEGILDDSKQKKTGFFRSWLNIGRDSAMKGLDIGNNAVNKITDTINRGLEAKYNAEVEKAKAEAAAKHGNSGEDYEAAVKKATEEAYEKFRSEEAQRKAQEEATAKLDEARADAGAEKAGDAGHTVEEWEWQVSEDGMSGKWVLKTSS